MKEKVFDKRFIDIITEYGIDISDLDEPEAVYEFFGKIFKNKNDKTTSNISTSSISKPDQKEGFQIITKTDDIREIEYSFDIFMKNKYKNQQKSIISRISQIQGLVGYIDHDMKENPPYGDNDSFKLFIPVFAEDWGYNSNLIYNAYLGSDMLWEEIIQNKNGSYHDITPQMVYSFLDKYKIPIEIFTNPNGYFQKYCDNGNIEEVKEWDRQDWGAFSEAIFEDFDVPKIKAVIKDPNIKMRTVSDDTGGWDGIIALEFVYTDIQQSIEEFNSIIGDKGKVVLIIPPGKSITESTEYNVDMNSNQAKKTLATLSQDLINSWQSDPKIKDSQFTNDKKKQMTQYTANIYANIITKNLLPLWTKNFKKLKITLESYQSFHTMEFMTPPFSQDFISRYVNGKQTLQQHIHKNSEIRIRMSPRLFHTMKDPNDAFNFFKAAVQYYDTKVEVSSKKLMNEVFKLGHNMKHLIATTKLSGLVSYPLTLLFSFSDVDMSAKDTFKVNNEDVVAVNKFIRNIVTRYAAPEKEKKEIIKDVKELVDNLRNELMNESKKTSENLKGLSNLPEAVEKLLFNGYDDIILEASRIFIEEQIDYDNKTPQSQKLYENFRVKKLKKIPRDLVAYISIETEAIRDANDKMMISSYCLSKIEIVEWYIELLEVGSKRYIVPHTKSYLEGIRTQLLACFKKIMDTKIINPMDRPIIDIKYPKGYEG